MFLDDALDGLYDKEAAIIAVFLQRGTIEVDLFVTVTK
jgi:hypothetical protein